MGPAAQIMQGSTIQLPTKRDDLDPQDLGAGGCPCIFGFAEDPAGNLYYIQGTGGNGSTGNIYKIDAR